MATTGRGRTNKGMTAWEQMGLTNQIQPNEYLAYRRNLMNSTGHKEATWRDWLFPTAAAVGTTLNRKRRTLTWSKNKGG